jgi:hypothetical protein
MAARVSYRSKWAVLAEEESSSDDDSSCVEGGKGDGMDGMDTVSSVTVTPPPSMDDVLRAMTAGDRSWADIMDEMSGVPVVTSAVCAPVVRARRANTWDDFCALPFSAGLRELWGDCYDCSSLTEADWNDMMRWLFDAGWDVGQYDRNCVEFEEGDGPARTWIPPAELEAMMEEEAALRARRPHPRRTHGHGHGHGGAAACCSTVAAPAPTPAPVPKEPKKVVVVPRFCREGAACTKTDCRYVHGDTIQRIDKPCGFGADCGKGDAAKRAMCLYMHPGEEWSESLVIRRPTVTA